MNAGMYKDENNGKQSKNDVDEPRHKNTDRRAIEAFHWDKLLLLLLQLHLCDLHQSHALSTCQV